MVKKLEDMCNRLDTKPAYDGWTDGRTDISPQHSPRYAYASRSSNNNRETTQYVVNSAKVTAQCKKTVLLAL